MAVILAQDRAETMQARRGLAIVDGCGGLIAWTDPEWRAVMSSLIVHHVDEAVVRALRERAAQHGRSVEAEHRILLAEALLRPRRRALAEVLAEMPDVGLDRDFERPSSAGAADVFD